MSVKNMFESKIFGKIVWTWYILENKTLGYLKTDIVLFCLQLNKMPRNIVLNVDELIWLTGKMFPAQGDLHIAPFTDEALYLEQFSKANFW